METVLIVFVAFLIPITVLALGILLAIFHAWAEKKIGRKITILDINIG